MSLWPRAQGVWKRCGRAGGHTQGDQYQFDYLNTYGAKGAIQFFHCHCTSLHPVVRRLFLSVACLPFGFWQCMLSCGSQSHFMFVFCIFACWAFWTDWCVVLSISGKPTCVVAVVYCLFSAFDSVELFCALLCWTLHTAVLFCAVLFCDPHTCVQWCAHKFVRVQAECIGWNLRRCCSNTPTTVSALFCFFTGECLCKHGPIKFLWALLASWFRMLGCHSVANTLVVLCVGVSVVCACLCLVLSLVNAFDGHYWWQCVLPVSSPFGASLWCAVPSHVN